MFTIVDDYTRECIAIEVDTSMNGKTVSRLSDRLASMRRLPVTITVDNGPEFTGKTMDEWAYRNKVNLERPVVNL
ncbi:transposase family protein [bacterium]|nr:transposase family protein [bacterium]